MEVVIEKVKEEDAFELLEFLKIVGEETDNLTFGKEGIPLSIEEEKTFLRSIKDSTSNSMFIARVDNEIVGNVTFNCSKNKRLKHHGSIAISVKKKMWNQKVGTKLMTTILDFAKNVARVEIVSLEVRSDNVNAIRLYQKFGFVKTGVYPGYLKVNDQLFDVDLMCLKFN